MIQHSKQNYVSPNTTDTEIPHISKDRYLAIQVENRELKQEVAKLKQRCAASFAARRSPPSKLGGVLHNCWQAAVCSYNESQEEIKELESHLNPGEAA